jgi:hypothetical protein
LSVPAAIVEVGDTDRPGKVLDLMSASATGLSEKDDRFWGSDADDLVHARSGNDLLFGRSGRDLLYSQSGNDGIDGGDGDDLLWGELGTDFIEGGGGDDVIYGGEHGDRLHGGDGNDLLVGDGGNDHLFADAGVDTLTGGSGYDAFAIGLGTGGMSLETTNLITDFTVAEDRIDLIDNFPFDRVVFNRRHFNGLRYIPIVRCKDNCGAIDRRLSVRGDRDRHFSRGAIAQDEFVAIAAKAFENRRIAHGLDDLDTRIARGRGFWGGRHFVIDNFHPQT